jgi:hemerythrin
MRLDTNRLLTPSVADTAPHFIAIKTTNKSSRGICKMAFITWTQELSTTVTKHDDEHKVLFDLLNKVVDAVGAGERGAVGVALDALIGFVVTHFASEEANMQAVNFPGFVAHKAEHDKLVATCGDLQTKFKAGQVEITAETAQFVKDWLFDHIPKVDFQYGPPMNAAGMG